MSDYKTPTYWFGPDGDGEPTLWRENRSGYLVGEPLAIMRRCDNGEAFDLLRELLEVPR